MSTGLTTREQLEKLAPELKSLADTIDRKAADGSDPTEEVERLSKMLVDHDKLAKAQAAIESARRLTPVAQPLDMSATLEQLNGEGAKSIEIDGKSGIVNPQGMTLGEAFAKSPGYQEFVKSFRGPDGAIRNGTTVNKQADFHFGSGIDTKALITGLSDTSAGAFVTTNRLPTIADLIGERRLTVADLCTRITINSDTFDYVTVTTKTNAAAPVLEATTSATPGLNNVAVGAYTAAHGLKPESTLAFAVVASIVETIAHMIPITRRAAADGGQVRQMVDQFLLYGLAEELEDQILNGNGTTPNLRGIVPVVGNTTGSAGTDIDAVVDGIALIRADNREPTAMVVHPNDWYSTGFLLAKNTAGNYIIGDPRATLDQLNSLWGMRVVVTPAMTENTILIGDFKQAVIADREQSAIYVTDSHNDWFQRNLLAILAEMRVGFGILDVDAFCTVTAV